MPHLPFSVGVFLFFLSLFVFIVILVKDSIKQKKQEKGTPRVDETSYRKSSRLKCPDCGGDKWVEGPSGGMSVNIMCANKDCLEWFNFMGPFGLERLYQKGPDRVSYPRPPDPPEVQERRDFVKRMTGRRGLTI